MIANSIRCDTPSNDFCIPFCTHKNNQQKWHNYVVRKWQKHVKSILRTSKIKTCLLFRIHFQKFFSKISVPIYSLDSFIVSVLLLSDALFKYVSTVNSPSKMMRFLCAYFVLWCIVSEKYALNCIDKCERKRKITTAKAGKTKTKPVN